LDKWEYCVLTWEGDGNGLKRAALFSHRPPWVKLDGSLVEVLARLGNDGWQAVNMVQPTRSSGWLSFPVYAMFKRPVP
jgi:hypothetical protein